MRPLYRNCRNTSSRSLQTQNALSEVFGEIEMNVRNVERNAGARHPGQQRSDHWSAAGAWYTQRFRLAGTSEDTNAKPDAVKYTNAA